VLCQLFQVHGISGGVSGSIAAWFRLPRAHEAKSRTMESRGQAKISVLVPLHY
jgi:hypothetical protein